MFVAIKQGNYTKAISFLDYNPEDVNQWCDKEERTALIHCAFIKEEGKGVGLATALLQTGARVATRDKYGLNTLHYACINQRVQLVSVLLNSLDCHVNAKCKRTGNTALHFTATNGNSNIARQLIQQLKRYHLSMEVKNRDGLTPLQVAVQAESHEVVQLLVEAGAERSVCVVSPFPPEPSDGATNSQSASSSSDRRSNSVESSSTSRVIALRQERNRLKPMIAPLRTKPSKPKPQICLKLRPVIVKHVGFVDRTELSRLDSLRGLAMNGKRQARSAELAASSTWRETLPVMWTKYSQQYSEAFREAAVPLIVEEESVVDPDDAQSSIADDLPPLSTSSGRDSGGKRRHSSVAAFQRNSGRRGTVCQPSPRSQKAANRRLSMTV